MEERAEQQVGANTNIRSLSYSTKANKKLGRLSERPSQPCGGVRVELCSESRDADCFGTTDRADFVPGMGCECEKQAGLLLGEQRASNMREAGLTTR